jgi:hypothetical protein
MSTIHTPAPIPYVASTLTDAECFRLHGTLTPERIERTITLRENFEAAADACTGHLNEAENGLPHEDFADEVIYDMQMLIDDEGDNLTPAVVEKIESLIDTLQRLQAAVFKGTETTARHLRSIEDTLAPWVGY